MDKLPEQKKINITTYLYFVFILLVMLIYYLTNKLRKYLHNRNELKSMAESYERKRECRNELKFHFYWAIDSQENKKAISLGNEIIKMDKELKMLYEQYQFYKKNGFLPFKKI